MNNFDDYPMESAKDGPYFMQIAREEKLRLSKIVDQIQLEITNIKRTNSKQKSAVSTNGKDEVLTALRSASALATHYISTHFTELEKLCKRNIDEMLPGSTVTNDDLWDFWNRIKEDVDLLDEQYLDLRRRKKSNWKKICLPLEPIDTLPELGDIQSPQASKPDNKNINKKSAKSSRGVATKSGTTKKTIGAHRSKSEKIIYGNGL